MRDARSVGVLPAIYLQGLHLLLRLQWFSPEFNTMPIVFRSFL